MNETKRIASVELLGERGFQAHTLREQGLSFAKMGKEMGLCAGRAREIYIKVEWFLSEEPRFTDGMQARVTSVLYRMNINSMDELREAYDSGKLHPWKHGPRNYGWQSHNQVERALGLPKTKKPSPSIKVCPNCGCNLFKK